MNKSDKIYIAGHRGMVGSALYRKLEIEGFTNFVTRELSQLDLRSQEAVSAPAFTTFNAFKQKNRTFTMIAFVHQGDRGFGVR